jgi:hypothetical protein
VLPEGDAAQRHHAPPSLQHFKQESLFRSTGHKRAMEGHSCLRVRLLANRKSTQIACLALLVVYVLADAPSCNSQPFLILASTQVIIHLCQLVFKNSLFAVTGLTRDWPFHFES